MKLNIFEGARRIALLIGGVWVIGCIAFAVFSEQYYPAVVYAVQRPGSQPNPADSCGYEDGSEPLTLQALNGESIRIELCFLARRANDGKMYIPYITENEGRTWRGNTKHSEEVQEYMRTVASTFKLTEEVIRQSKASERKVVVTLWKDSMSFLFGGLAVGWALLAATGWIVRGFMGIPRGTDARPRG